MPEEQRYHLHLSDALDIAEQLAAAKDGEAALQKYIQENEGLRHPLKALSAGEKVFTDRTVASGIQTIVGNFAKNKYLYSILLTCLVEKLVHPSQDIRIAQTNLEGGYSNRSTDQMHITPFLSHYGLTHCAASGVESGRNFERPMPFTLDYSGKPDGAGNREAFLGIINAVQLEGVDPKPCIALLMTFDKLTKKKAIYQYPKPAGLTIDDIHTAVMNHYRGARGNGRARLPVLAIQAIYTSLTVELSRYKDCVLRDPPNRHTGNDKEGWIGDVQVDRLDASPFEAVEVKADKQITPGMVAALPSKFAGQTVDRYYILSSSVPYIKPEQRDDVEAAVKNVRDETGSQIIVNGLIRSLWYYLRMITNTDLFIAAYTQQVQTDQDVKEDHRKLWAEILKELAT